MNKKGQHIIEQLGPAVVIGLMILFIIGMLILMNTPLSKENRDLGKICKEQKMGGFESKKILDDGTILLSCRKMFRTEQTIKLKGG